MPVTTTITQYAMICGKIQIPIPRTIFDKIITIIASNKPYRSPIRIVIRMTNVVTGCTLGMDDSAIRPATDKAAKIASSVMPLTLDRGALCIW
ncbi:hypothetical protein J5TS2_02760 [Brevibacillus halotolerans]|nr:hypothetical protein J5TS2_02760 [Brevibacillus halotolerans]